MRPFYVTKADTDEPGTTKGCSGCDHHGTSSRKGHNPVCRKRMFDEISKDDADRVSKLEEAMIRGAQQEHQEVEDAPAVRPAAAPSQAPVRSAAPAVPQERPTAKRPWRKVGIGSVVPPATEGARKVGTGSVVSRLPKEHVKFGLDR